MMRPTKLAVFAFRKPPLKFLPVPLANRLEPEEREIAKKAYINIKRYCAGGGFAAIGTYELIKLIVDSVKTKTILHGYKNVILMNFYPATQLAATAIYVSTNIPKIRLAAKLISEIGVAVYKRQLQCANAVFICTDLVLFGELVDITEGKNFSIFHNETANAIETTINDLLK